MYTPEQMAVTSNGTLYFADGGTHQVDKVSQVNGVITPIAGTGHPGAQVPGPALSSPLENPHGLVVDSLGNVYFSDDVADVIDKVTPAGTLSVVAGNGTSGKPVPGPALSSPLLGPGDLAMDGAGNIFFADVRQVLKLGTSGTLSVVAGTGLIGTPTNGPATSASLDLPRGVALRSDGTLAISDVGAHEIYEVSPTGQLTIIVGTGVSGAPTAGPAIQSKINDPYGISLDSSDNLLIADTSARRILSVTKSGTLSVIAGNGKVGKPHFFTPAKSSAMGYLDDVLAVGKRIFISDDTNSQIDQLYLPLTVKPIYMTATVGTAFHKQLTGGGGTAPYTFSYSSGTLPPGTSLSSSGLLSGTPTTAGTYQFYLDEHDSAIDETVTAFQGFQIIVS